MTKPTIDLRIDSGRSSGGLPDDVLDDSRRRLFLACVIYAIVFLLAYGLPLLFFASSGPQIDRLIPNLAATLSIGVALLFAGLLRTDKVKSQLMLDLGLVFEVVSCFGIAMSEWWPVFSPAYVESGKPFYVGLSWCFIWIISLSGMVPATIGKKIISSSLAAAMPPLVMFSSYAYFQPEVPDGFLTRGAIGSAIVGSIVVGLAVVMSRIVHGLGRKLREARRVGSYQLVEQLGAGGMGEVWRGEHRLLARPAAVKLVRRSALESLGGASIDRAMRRFEREAQETAQLRCPHTINLYDFGIAENGTFYYVMELLDGLDLESLVSNFGPQPAERVVHLLRQACQSLDEAHHRGLIHRDIKPANIFCCRYGLEVDFVKVLDFGLVKPIRKSGPEATKLTAEGTLAGTPAYMAPESVLGDTEVDSLVDIYALGCVAYWLLTAQLVFDASSPMRLAIKHVKEPPVPPSTRTELPVPKWLDDLIIQCLAKEPSDRPQTAGELIERLNANQLDRAWDPTRAAAWWSLHKPEEVQTTARDESGWETTADS